MKYDASLLTAHSNHRRERVSLVDQSKCVSGYAQTRVVEQRTAKPKEMVESGKTTS